MGTPDLHSPGMNIFRTANIPLVTTGVAAVVVLVLLALAVTMDGNLLSTRSSAPLTLTSSVRQLCVELRRQCVGLGKPSHPTLTEVCQAASLSGTGLCAYRFTR